MLRDPPGPVCVVTWASARSQPSCPRARLLPLRAWLRLGRPAHTLGKAEPSHQHHPEEIDGVQPMLEMVPAQLSYSFFI